MIGLHVAGTYMQPSVGPALSCSYPLMQIMSGRVDPLKRNRDTHLNCP